MYTVPTIDKSTIMIITATVSLFFSNFLLFFLCRVKYNNNGTLWLDDCLDQSFFLPEKQKRPPFVSSRQKT